MKGVVIMAKKSKAIMPEQIVETNASDPDNTYEYASCSTAQICSNYYFGFNLLEFYSYEDLTRIVKDPMENNDLLRRISRTLYSTNGTYTNTVDYMRAMPTLDRVIIKHGKGTKKADKNKDLFETTLRTIKDKEIIRDALWRGMIDGIAFYYFETTGNPTSMQKTLNDYEVDSIIEINELGVNASVISLPADYTQIVGRKNNSYVIAFDLNYFNNASGETAESKLRRFPKEIRDGYNARKNQDGLISGNNWLVLDNSKTIVHKIRSEIKEKYGRPLVLAAISDILYNDYFTDTKRNVLGEINNKVIYQTFPEGQVKGTCALTSKQQVHQHDTVKSAVMNKNNRGGTSFFSIAAGTKLNVLDVGNTDIFDKKYEEDLGDKIARALGFAGSAIDGVGSGSYSAQQTNLELVSAQIFEWVEQIASELNKCISKNIIKDNRNWVEVKYLPITYVNKGSMIGYMQDLYLKGKGSLSLWASACGISPDVFFSMLDQELEEDIENKYPVHKTSFVLSKDDSENGGRPKTDNPTENTVRSRANDGNSIPTPSDKK